MAAPKLGKSKDRRDMHYSVGALIERGGKYLLIDRIKEPLGFASLAGHVDEDETPEQTLVREVEEESGLKVENHELFAEELIDQERFGPGNKCIMGVGLHYWYLFRCKASGKLKLDKHEAKTIGWYSVGQIKKMSVEKKLEPVWEYWFEKLGLV